MWIVQPASGFILFHELNTGMGNSTMFKLDYGAISDHAVAEATENFDVPVTGVLFIKWKAANQCTVRISSSKRKCYIHYESRPIGGSATSEVLVEKGDILNSVIIGNTEDGVHYYVVPFKKSITSTESKNIQSGTANIGDCPVGGSKDGNITFDQEFVLAPKVFVCLYGQGNYHGVNVQVISVTNNGFAIRINNDGKITYAPSIMWLAVSV